MHSARHHTPALVAQNVPDAQLAVRAANGDQAAFEAIMRRHNRLLFRTWDEKTLDRFLAQPLKAVPGTTMTYDGVPGRKDRADLIAYLRHAADSPECPPR